MIFYRLDVELEEDIARDDVGSVGRLKEYGERRADRLGGYTQLRVSSLAEYLVLLRNFLESFDTIPAGGRIQRETAEKKGEGVAEEKQSFWQMLLSGRVSTERERKVLEYICHRVGNGAHLRDVMQEEYVRRHASSDEVQGILDNPRLVETAHEKMREDFSSGYLDPKPSRSSTQ